MSDLRITLDELRAALEQLPSSATAAQVAPLEEQARTLLGESKNTPFEEEARQLFNQLAKRNAGNSVENPELRGILRRARIRIDIAGDDHDYDEAIDILAQALAIDPNNGETHELLMQAAKRSSQHEVKVRGLLERYGIRLNIASTSADVVPLPPPVATPPSSPATSNAPSVPQPMYVAGDLLSQITAAYYAGDYSQTIDLANRLLSVDPDNMQAQDYRQKSEDNLVRGVVPDHRIPFDARVAYNRANSLVRAGNYDEAQRLYREARDIADRAGIPTWKDVEQALLEIEDLALARELLTEGDRHLAADDWGAALGKYEGALRVVPNDPQAEERIRLVRQVRTQYEQANAQLSTMSGSIIDRANTLGDILNMLMTIRQTLPSSDRLRQAVAEVNSKLQGIKTQLVSQGEGAMLRMESAQSVEDKLRLANEALDLLELAVQIDPSDPKALTALQQAQQVGAELGGGRQIMDRAASYIAQNTDNELAQARQMLSGMRQQAQDPRYRMLVSELLNRYLERVEFALDKKDARGAERWLEITKEDPFRILGRRTEVLRFEEDIRKLKFKRTIRTGMMLGVVLLLLVVGAFLSQGVWKDSVFPPATATPIPPSMTASATATATASDTPTPSDTPPATLVPDNQTATVSFIQTRSAGTAQFIMGQTATVDARNFAFTQTVQAQDDQATISANVTAIQATNVARTAEAQSQINQMLTLTATAWTLTPSPTLSLTPSLTPSPTENPVLCRVFNNFDGNVNVRSEPTSNSTAVSTMTRNQSADVLEQRYGSTNANQLWYRITFGVGSSRVVGWVLSDYMVDITSCPPPPDRS